GELQRDAEVQRVVARALAPATPDADADHADGRRDASAVLEEIPERLIARGVEIHRDAVDDVLERLAREIEPPHERLQAAALIRPGRLPGEHARQLRAPELDSFAPVRQ